jgi:WD40 repeat protein
MHQPDAEVTPRPDPPEEGGGGLGHDAPPAPADDPAATPPIPASSASGLGVILLFDAQDGTPHLGEVQAAVESLPEHLRPAPSQVSQRSFERANEAFRSLMPVCADLLPQAAWEVMNWEGHLTPGLAALRGMHLGKLRAHGKRLSVLAATADGRVVSASDDGTIAVWNSATWRRVHSLSGTGSAVTSLALTPEDQVIAGFRNGDIRVWDLADGQEQAPLARQHAPLDAPAQAAQAPQARGEAPQQNFWRHVWLYLNEPIGRQRQGPAAPEQESAPVLMRAASGAIHTVTTDPKGQLALSADDDGVISVWDLKRRALLYSFSDDSGASRTRSWACVVMRDGCAVTGREDGSLHLYDLGKRRLRRRWSPGGGGGQRSSVNALVLIGDGRSVLVGTDDGALRRIDLGGEEPRIRWEQRQADAVLACAVTADGKSVVSATRNMVTLWDAETGEQRKEEPQVADIWSMAVVGEQVVVGCADGSLRAKSLVLLGVSPSATPDRTAALLGNVERYVQTVDGNTLQPRDVRSGRPERQISLEGGPIQAVDPIYGTALGHVEQEDGRRSWVDFTKGAQVESSPSGSMWLEVKPPTALADEPSRGLSVIIPVTASAEPSLRSGPVPRAPVLLDGPWTYSATMELLARHLYTQRRSIRLERSVRPIQPSERAGFEETWRTARVIIMLLHADYLAEVAEREREVIRRRLAENQLTLLPIILKRCHITGWEELERTPRLELTRGESLDSFCQRVVAELKKLLDIPP